MPEKKSTPSRDAKDWLAKARHFADAGDRWFVNVAKGIGSAAGVAAERARTEAQIVSESAQKAADTTVKVTRKVVAGLSTAPPARKAGKRLKALIKALQESASAFETRLDAIDDEKFQQVLEELQSQVSFELSTLPEAPAQAAEDKAPDDKEPPAKEETPAEKAALKDPKAEEIVRALGASKEPSPGAEPERNGKSQETETGKAKLDD